MKRPNEQQKSRGARERIADIPAASQDTRKISADQLAEVLARVDGKRAPAAAALRAPAAPPSDDSDVSGARPVARHDDDASSERLIAKVGSSPPSSTQRITVTVDAPSAPSVPASQPVTAVAPAEAKPAPVRTDAAASLLARPPANTTNTARRSSPTRLVFLLLVLALALTALYAVVRR